MSYVLNAVPKTVLLEASFILCTGDAYYVLYTALLISKFF